MLKGKEVSNSPRRAAILQIAYSPIVLATRQMLLEAHGYLVRSVLGNEEAFALVAECKEAFDLVLIGHDAEIFVRREAAQFVKQNYRGVRVIALRSDYYVGEVEEADYNSDVENPREWLCAVDKFAA